MLTGVRWVDALIIVSVAVTAWLVVWRKLIKPAGKSVQRLVHSLETATEVIPILVTIATEFQPNGGHSLKDSLNRIEGVQAVQGGKLDALYTYAHGTRHLQAGQIAGLALFDEGITRKLDALAVHLDPVPRKLDAIATAAGAADASAVEHRESHPESPGE